MQLGGIHHVTAVTADAPGNLAFYTQTLGMRLVKKTVNQDDVSAYHLFYADGRGTPGTDLTFFDWPAAPDRRGTNSIVRIGMRVASSESLRWWAERFAALRIRHEPIARHDGRETLDFEDPEGQRLTLVADETASDHGEPWLDSPVPAAHQVRGLGPVTISVPDLQPTHEVLTELLGMRKSDRAAAGAAPESAVYEMGQGGPGAELHVLVEHDAPRARLGAGGVHHVAFRAPTVEAYEQWNERLAQARIPFSGPVDRYYFRSLYLREPNGILFEIATDEPGFAVDEPADQLGQSLALPPFLEPRRDEIEANLKPLSP